MSKNSVSLTHLQIAFSDTFWAVKHAPTLTDTERALMWETLEIALEHIATNAGWDDDERTEFQTTTERMLAITENVHTKLGAHND